MELIKALASKVSKFNERLKASRNVKDLSIGFACGFHGNTGAPVAIANTANGLSKVFQVDVEIREESYFNYHLSPAVNKVNKIGEDHDIYIFDLRINPDIVARMKSLGKFIIISIHGYKPPPITDAFPKGRLERMLELADLVHFVAEVQQKYFQLASNDYFVIPNCVKPVSKKTMTQNVGVVGALNKPHKNAAKSVEVALKSKCNEIHLWSTDLRVSDNNRVVHHSWEYDREKIYNSFDVLVFFSEKEALSLAVIESLSAGIPCVLANIDFFKPFTACPGVELVDLDNLEHAHTIVDEFLKKKADLSSSIIAHYQNNYTPEIIDNLWRNKIISIAEERIRR